MSTLIGRSMGWARAIALAPLALAVSLALAPLSAGAAEDSQSAEPIDAQAVYQQALEAEWSGAYALARPLLEQAAELGHARANYQLGFLKMDGLGGPRDVEAARQHFRRAADEGLSLALVPLVYAYDDFADLDSAPDPMLASHALLELAQRDLGMAGDTIQFWSQPLRRQIQRDLREAGLYRGPIDGLIGQGSLNALRAFGRNRSRPLPDTDRARFQLLTLSAAGFSTDGAAVMAYDDAETLRDAREALGGVTLEVIDVETQWRVSSMGTTLLDWFPQRGASEAPPAFQLPGKPAGAMLRFGMPRSALSEGELGQCGVNTARTPDGGLVKVRQCATRHTDVRLVFQAQNPQPIRTEAQVMGVGQQTAPDTPENDLLVQIEVSSPLSLRLAGN